MNNAGVTHLEKLEADDQQRAQSADATLQTALGKAVKNYGDTTDMKQIVKTFNRICMVSNGRLSRTATKKNQTCTMNL